MFEIFAPDAGVETVVGVVGEFDRLVLVVESVEADHRTERFGRAGEHVVRNTLEDGGLIERWSQVRTRLPAS